jgi:hypothetical protein
MKVVTIYLLLAQEHGGDAAKHHFLSAAHSRVPRRNYPGRPQSAKYSGFPCGDMQGMPTRGLILAYLTWRMRLIPAKPRKVRFWSGGVKPAEFYAARERLRPLLMKVEAGKDLTPHLSDEVNRKGVVLRKPGNPDGGRILIWF